MSPLETGLVAIATIIVLLLLRLPIGLALGAVAFLGIWEIRGIDVALAMLRIIPFDFVSRWEFAALPMFMLMGAFAHFSGISAAIFRAARLWLGFLPGGLALASNFGCAGFAAATGSSLVAAAVMGRVTIPEMLKAGYDKALATGTVAAAGTLGSLIPPSMLMILFGVFTETSINKLLIAGLLPGILTAVVYGGMIALRCSVDRSLAPSVAGSVTWEEKLDSLKDVWPLILLIIGIIGGLYGGVFTATEAGAAGAAISFLLALFKGQMTLKVFFDSLLESASALAKIFFMVIGAVLLTKFFAMTNLPAALNEVIQGRAVSTLEVVMVTLVIYLILGMFLDSIGVMLLTLPFLLPLFHANSIDMIWMGVLIIKFLEVGLLTPPVGMNVYVVKSVVGDAVELSTIFKGVLWFLLCEVLVITALIAYPEISLYLPNLMK